MAAARECATQVFALLGAADATTYLPTDAGYVTLDRAGYIPRSGHLVGRTGWATTRPCRSSTTASAPGTTRTSTWWGGQLADHRDVESDPHAHGALQLRAADGMLEDLGERP